MSAVDLARVAVAESQALYRAALSAALDDEPSMTVVAEAVDLQTGLQACADARPDLVVVAAELQPEGGAELCARIKAKGGPTRVLVVADVPDEHTLLEAVEAGADGFVDRGLELAALLDAVHRVRRGEAVVPPDLLGALLHRLIVRRRESDRALRLMMKLTRREKEVLELLADGCDPESIASILVISPQTARSHVQRVMSKLGVHSRLEAAVLAIEHGLVQRQPVGGLR